MPEGKSEIERFEDGVGQLLTALDKLPTSTSAGNNITKIIMDSSSLATLVLSVLCSFLCGVVLVGIFIIFQLSQRISTNSDYVHAIYMQIPQIQKLEKHKNEQPDNYNHTTSRAG